MNSRMKKLGCALVLAIVTAGLMPTLAVGAGFFEEDFTTTTYKGSTSAVWSTADGEIRMGPFYMDWDFQAILTGQPRDMVVDGNYIYIAAYTAGLVVMDISNPLSPSIAGSYNTTGTSYGIAVDGNIAYLADGGSGLQILDISDPATPVLIGNVDPYGSAYDVVVDGNTAFLASDYGGIHAIDIMDPTAPNVLDTITTTSTVRDLVLDGDLLHSVSYTHHYRIFDVSDPSLMLQVGFKITPGNAYGLFVEGNTAYVADGSGGLLVLDVTDPALPVQVGAAATGGDSRDVCIVGGYAYVADYTDGLTLLDVRDPASIQTITTGTATASGMAVTVAGNSAYLAATGGLLYGYQAAKTIPLKSVGGQAGAVGYTHAAIVGDVAFVAAGNNGLYIYDINDPENPNLLGQFKDPAYTWSCKQVEVAGDYAFIADAIQGFVVLDISDLSNPTLANKTAGSFSAIAIEGDRAALLGGSSIYAFSLGSLPAIGVMGPMGLAGTGWSLDIEGNYVYVALGAPGIQVLEFFPSAGVRFSPVTVFDTSYAYDVAVDGDQAYVADSYNGVVVLDVSNPAVPSQIGTYATSASALDVRVRGDDLFVGVQLHGIVRLDITDPAIPTLIDAYDGSYTAASVAVAGNHVYLGNSTYGMETVAVSQRMFDPWSNYANSTVFATLSSNAVQARLSTIQTEDVTWELSSDGGTAYAPVAADGNWYNLASPGTQLKWRSNHTVVRPQMNPSCSNLQFEWLYDIPTVDAIVDVPGDQGRQVSLAWERSGYDFVGSAMPITEYAVYRRIDSLASMESGVAEWDKAYPPGDWHFVTTVPADAEDQYAVVVPTLGDSTITDGMYESVFFVRARTATPGVYFDAAPDSGYSVDNLAPSVPTGFVLAAADQLAWNENDEPDFRYFTVYGSANPTLDGTAVVIDHTTGTMLTISGPNPGYYFLTATDFAGNESPAVVVNMVSEVPDATTPLHSALFPNHPNPFNPSTVIRFDLAKDVPVRLTVFDIAGRTVRTLIDGRKMTAGRHEEQWDGRSNAGRPAPAGIYLYRFEAGDHTETRRMSLVK
ncbi:MAG: FlgD immunoglobulin-like domain containing protein [Candidatus Krumholzibacteriota bacterium]